MRRPLQAFASLTTVCLLATTFAATAHASPFTVRSLETETGPPSLPDQGDGSTPGASSGGDVAPQQPAAQQPSSTATAPATQATPAETPAPAVEPAGTEPAGTEGTEATPGEDPTTEGPEVDENLSDDPTLAGEETEEELTLDGERDKVGDDGGYNKHGIGFRAGLTVIPTWVLSGFLASHTNALCRGATGGFAEDRGLTKTQGCNFYVGGEYIFRQSPVFDIVASVGYQRAKAPDGYWLDKDEWADGCVSHDESAGCDLGAADYTELDLGFVFLEADFIGRYPVVNRPDFKFQLGGGGGLGLGIIVGPGVFQTPIGRNATGDPTGAVDEPTCNTISDLSDFEKCTPRYWDDPDVDQNGDGMTNMAGDLVDPPTPPGGDLSTGNLYANCTKDECRSSDLEKFGSRRKQEDIPPVIPVVNLIISARFVIKDVVGINLQGGWNTGFYFGGGVQYFFGKKKAKKPATASRPSFGASRG